MYHREGKGHGVTQLDVPLERGRVIESGEKSAMRWVREKSHIQAFGVKQREKKRSTLVVRSQHTKDEGSIYKRGTNQTTIRRGAARRSGRASNESLRTRES